MTSKKWRSELLEMICTNNSMARNRILNLNLEIEKLEKKIDSNLRIKEKIEACSNAC